MTGMRNSWLTQSGLCPVHSPGVIERGDEDLCLTTLVSKPPLKLGSKLHGLQHLFRNRSERKPKNSEQQL